MTKDAGTTTMERKTAVEELHLFHYLTHSLLVTIQIVAADTCPEGIDHTHTPDGQHLYRRTEMFTVRDDAERRVSQHLGDFVDDRTIFDAVTLVRHETEPSGRPYAVKIDATNGADGNPRRGWMIYTPAGRYLGFITETTEDRAGRNPLAAAGEALELCTVPATARFYQTCLQEQYPHAG
ncbi:hypothetical protein JNW91_00580 [Micromonospora sp. STR1_7]|uniref:Uncharacterized protein n=1 Tax=Micromonospora parastrephiae TaxID=2806101 RepID=A0ABS1XMP7_9ACTN|nr:hypothetical protein [Micromonospora parastrephiae]MBM0230497.1 hypothetical protein [Micromonospora parastrephiae]